MNPGFLLDALAVVLATSMPDPVSVFARRVSDISTWGPTVLRSELGFGTTGQPETYVISPTGVAACGGLGPVSDADLEAWLAVARGGGVCA